jgi:putative PIN family toxin of toxin-antitoxin system
LRTPRIVLDTLVVVSALVGPERGSSRRVVWAVASGEVRLATSDDFFREISRVIRYPDVTSKIRSPVTAFEIALELGLMGELNRPRKLEWPSLRDPDDAWMLDLAWNSHADYIVTRDPHLLNFTPTFPVEIVVPPQLLRELEKY